MYAGMLGVAVYQYRLGRRGGMGTGAAGEYVEFDNRGEEEEVLQ
jgi:hypothetical protein